MSWSERLRRSIESLARQSDVDAPVNIEVTVNRGDPNSAAVARSTQDTPIVQGPTGSGSREENSHE